MRGVRVGVRVRSRRGRGIEGVWVGGRCVWDGVLNIAGRKGGNFMKRMRWSESAAERIKSILTVFKS